MYCLSQDKTLLGDSDSTPPLIEIADFDRDGMFDLIYPSDQQIVVLKNQLDARGVSDQLCHSHTQFGKQIFEKNPQTSSKNALVHNSSKRLDIARSL